MPFGNLIFPGMHKTRAHARASLELGLVRRPMAVGLVSLTTAVDLFMAD